MAKTCCSTANPKLKIETPQDVMWLQNAEQLNEPEQQTRNSKIVQQLHDPAGLYYSVQLLEVSIK